VIECIGRSSRRTMRLSGLILNVSTHYAQNTFTYQTHLVIAEFFPVSLGLRQAPTYSTLISQRLD
jgi:hypothetical protein